MDLKNRTLDMSIRDYHSIATEPNTPRPPSLQLPLPLQLSTNSSPSQSPISSLSPHSPITDFRNNIIELPPVIKRSIHKNIQKSQSQLNIEVSGDLNIHQNFLKSLGGINEYVVPIQYKDKLIKYFDKEPIKMSIHINDVYITMIPSSDCLYVHGNIKSHYDYLISNGGKLDIDKNCCYFTIKKLDQLLQYFDIKKCNDQMIITSISIPLLAHVLTLLTANTQLIHDDNVKIYIPQNGNCIIIGGVTSPYDLFLKSIGGKLVENDNYWIFSDDHKIICDKMENLHMYM